MAGLAAQSHKPMPVAELKLLVLREAISRGLLDDATPLVGFIDEDGIRKTVAELQQSFGDNFFHSFAVKANSIHNVLSILCKSGMGAEVASFGELAQALKAGFKPADIVLDEPAKTELLIREVLERSVNLNIDNFQEFEAVKRTVKREGARSRIGFRVNPQVGAGHIAAMSTAQATSKFGVPLVDAGLRDQIIDLYCRHSWLTSVHTHVGSQGCPMELMAEGISRVVELAEEVNQKVGTPQITTINIGGGLTVNFDGDEIAPRFSDYADVLRERVPALFSGRYRVVTEFGRSVLAKNGFIASKVEYTKMSGGRRIAITHAGAQVAARTVFMPEAWPIRISAHNSDGSPKSTPVIGQNIAGPCCFDGDMLSVNRELPLLEKDDFVMLHETGAYYLSNPFYYNSLPAPPVYGFSYQSEE